MNRTEKSEFIEEIRASFESAPLLILTDFKGVTVAQIDKVRREIEKAGAEFRVVKNSLCRIAVTGTEREGLVAHFRGNVGVVISGEDASATAKLFRTLAKENDKLVVRAGYFDGTLLSATEVDGVADLPSREQLLSTLLATIEEGPKQLLRVIQAPARDLLYLLNNFASKLETGESA